MNAPFTWTDERVTLLRKLWLADGLSCSQIAQQLGGITRNAVIGKLTRLGINDRTKAASPTAAKTTLRAVRPKAVVAPPAISVGFKRAPGEVPPTIIAEAKPLEGAAEPRKLFDRGAFQCCYPVGGSGAETLYCCETTDRAPNWQYCTRHLQIMGRSPVKWEKDAVWPRRAA
jgi:hypothetical protein